MNNNIEVIEDFINLGIVLNDKSEVLMIRRALKEKGKDGSVLEWAFPGGKQRLNETREECVKRGVLAKTGYEVESIREISLRIHPQFLVSVVYHLCKLVSKKPIAKSEESYKVAEIKWVKKEKVKDLITTDLDKKVSQELGLS